MRLSVSPGRKVLLKLSCTAYAIVVAALMGATTTAQAEPQAAAVAAASKPSFRREAVPFADRLPNVVLKTHEGKNVRFYEDLLKDKIVLINFMYATCKER